MNWIRVTKSKPCPICGKPDWCTFQINVTVCMRIESGKPCSNGGYFHKTGDAKGESVQAAGRFDVKVDFVGLQKTYRRNLNGELAKCASLLGVTEDSLNRLGMGWDGVNCTFPMRDATGKITGIRLRSYDGKKKAVRGSKEGLFFAEPMGDELVVCEGPTDATALLSIGCNPIGRPHCLGGANEIAIIAKTKTIIGILADNDAPGMRGAKSLAVRIGVPMTTPPEGTKDVRAWTTINGATSSEVLTKINAARQH